MKPSVLVSLILCLLVTSCSKSMMLSLPAQAWHSPRATYIAQVQETTSESAEPSRSLVIRRLGGGSAIFSMPIERHVEVLWSPGEHFVALLDHFASNEDAIRVIGLPSGQCVLSIERDLVTQLSAGAPDAREYSHVYFEKVTWNGPVNLSTRIYMYDPISGDLPSAKSALLSFDVRARGRADGQTTDAHGRLDGDRTNLPR